jgi:hypothetical protein
MHYFVGVVLLFTFVFYAFNPGGEPPTFGQIFDFGYNVTVRPLEVLSSIRDGFGDFLDNLVAWFNSLF